MTKQSFKITSLSAYEILDSRGNPTLEVNIEVDGMKATAMVPSGASTGKHEALELRDGDKNRYKGLGVLKAVQNVNEEISASLIGKQFDQQKLDNFLIKLDGSENKSRLGANAILGISMAFARAGASMMGMELYEYLGRLAGNNDFQIPQPMLNIINGGKHADSGLDIQEFMLAPIGFDSFARKIQAGSEIIHTLKDLLKKKGYTVSVGDEGGFAPKLQSNEEALDLMVEAIKEAGYDTERVKIGMDVAASSFYENDTYTLKINGQKQMVNSDQLIDWYEKLVAKYPIMLIEDGLAEDDWQGFSSMTKRLGEKIKVVGDDLLVTNIKRIKEAIKIDAVNSVLIKLNQIGTVSETIDAVNLTKQQGWTPFVSHRSGETTDTFIADLSVGLGCPLIKSGSLVRGERACKYNRLMEIERRNLSI
jgi:enolase